ncbi:endospore germination permease [Siminovitchia sediminis]|uniref:Endospore germination permease n=1 Tax=Siminovitchia sediminis TaxID=1274353 RepID=A0ABW4KDY6_9BACI
MEGGKISSLQMALLLYPAIIATAILSVPGAVAEYAGRDMWIAPMIASLAGFLSVFIMVCLHERYPGKTVIEFSEEIIGRIPGKIFGFFIIFFYLGATGVVVRAYSDFLNISFLLKTPQAVVAASMVLVCALCVHGGVEVMARSGQILLPLFFLPLLVVFMFLAPDFEVKNILPVLENGMIPPLKGAVIPAGWFAEFFLISFLLPFLSNPSKAMKYGFLSVFITMLTLVLVNLVVLFILGETTKLKTYPLIIVGRYASLAEFFENLEAVIVAVWIIGAFIKITVFYYAVVLAAAQWLKLSDFRPIIWPFGILIVQFAFLGLPNTMVFNRITEVFPFYSLLFQVLIPLFLLIIAMARRKKGKKNAGNSGSRQ